MPSSALLHRGASHGSQASAPKSAQEISAAAEKAKKKEKPRLALSCLGSPEKVSRAVGIVGRMTDPAASAAGSSAPEATDESTPLPTKMDITKRMAVLDARIKSRGKDATAANKEVRALEAKEAEDRETKRKARREAEENAVREETDGVAGARSELAGLVAARDGAVKALRARAGGERRKLASSHEERRARGSAENEAEGRAEAESEGSAVASKIAALRSELNAAEDELRELDFPPGGASRLLGGLPPSASALPDLDEANDGTGAPTLDGPGKMAGLVASIIAGNQRIAKRAHLEALEVIPYTPGCGTGGTSRPSGSSSPAPSSAGRRGPAKKRHRLTNEEWSNRARDVTGLHDALYASPEDVPNFDEHNASFLRNRSKFADAIRRKKDALAGRWTDLARTYLVRQHDYQKETGVNTEEAGGVFCAAALMHGADGGSGGLGFGGAGGSSSSGGLESELVPGVRGNNPYRRPRRGISPGDICRSDYEQEQIIAEIAAKEAMERRIKEGGCALPRQVGWLERVSFLFALRDAREDVIILNHRLAKIHCRCTIFQTTAPRRHVLEQLLRQASRRRPGRGGRAPERQRLERHGEVHLPRPLPPPPQGLPEDIDLPRQQVHEGLHPLLLRQQEDGAVQARPQGVPPQEEEAGRRRELGRHGPGGPRRGRRDHRGDRPGGSHPHLAPPRGLHVPDPVLPPHAAVGVRRARRGGVPRPPGRRGDREAAGEAEEVELVRPRRAREAVPEARERGRRSPPQEQGQVVVIVVQQQQGGRRRQRGGRGGCRRRPAEKEGEEGIRVRRGRRGRTSRPAAGRSGRERRRQLEAVKDEAPEVEGEGEGGPVRRARAVW